MKIDAHHHFWKYDPDTYSWMNENMDILKVDYQPADLKRETEISEFPDRWIEYMKKHVKFYNKIGPNEQEEFKNRILQFINSTRIIGYAGIQLF